MKDYITTPIIYRSILIENPLKVYAHMNCIVDGALVNGFISDSSKGILQFDITPGLFIVSDTLLVLSDQYTLYLPVNPYLPNGKVAVFFSYCSCSPNNQSAVYYRVGYIPKDQYIVYPTCPSSSDSSVDIIDECGTILLALFSFEKSDSGEVIRLLNETPDRNLLSSYVYNPKIQVTETTELELMPFDRLTDRLAALLADHTGGVGGTGGTGSRGLQGCRGLPGHTGHTGGSGGSGDTGDTGGTGNTGGTGHTGHTGHTGGTGYSGGTGDTGHTGGTGGTGGFVDLDRIYPIGSIYLNTINVSPAILFKIGIWEQIKDVFLFGAGKLSAGSTGGEPTVQLESSNIPSHSHNIPTMTLAADEYNLSKISNTTKNIELPCACKPILYPICNYSGTNYSGNFQKLQKNVGFKIQSGLIPMSFIPKDSTNVNIRINSGTADDDIEIFTVDGFHISGTPLTDALWNINGITSSNINSILITKENGFNSSAYYRTVTTSTALRAKDGNNDYTGVFIGSDPWVGGTNGVAWTDPSYYKNSAYKTISFYRSSDESTIMKLSYTGDYDFQNGNSGRMASTAPAGATGESIKIDKASEDLIVFILGHGQYTIYADWDYMPVTYIGDPPISLEYNSYKITNGSTATSHNNMPPYLVVYMWKRVG